VKNESDYLHATQDEPASHPAGSAHAEPVVVHLPLYRAGSHVSYQGRDYTVGHVVISRSVLQVYLQELGSSVDAEKVQVSPTRLVLQRS